MKSEKFSCLFWLIVFLASWGAAAWFVHRRAPETSAAVIGGFIGAILILLTLAYLFAIPDRIREWLLIVRAKLGREPRDGKRIALIGNLRGHGDLAAPFSHQRCVAYEYEIQTRVVTNSDDGTSIEMKKAYEGFAMVPMSIEHGADRTRLLAKPEMRMSRERQDGMQVIANAKAYVASTTFEESAPPAKDQPDLSHTDGRYRRDSQLRADATLDDCTFYEKTLQGNIGACAIGTYSQDKRALLPPVTLRTGASFAIGAAWRIVGAGVGTIIFAAITLVSAALFCANYPLDAAESSSPEWTPTWPEIELERFIDQEVRSRMVRVGLLSTDSGFYLQDVCVHCAKGQVLVGDRTIELKHAAEIGPRTIHLSPREGDRDGLTLYGRDRVTLTLDGKLAPIPASWFRPNDIVTALGSGRIADYAGRITIIAPDRWIRARVTFKTRVNSDAWLPGHTPPAQP